MNNNSNFQGNLSLAETIKKLRRTAFFHGYIKVEGSASIEELQYLQDTIREKKVKKVLEIGFNMGYSSYAMLQADPEVTIISFDLGNHGYTKLSKKYIDERFPGRHELIYGDSTKTIPAFSKEHPNARFDLAFVDGGHDYEIARQDLSNIHPLCTENTVVVIDDLTPWQRWGQGPTKAWKEVLENGIIKQEELFRDGVRVEKIEPPGNRSWARGYFIY